MFARWGCQDAEHAKDHDKYVLGMIWAHQAMRPIDRWPG